MVQLAQEFFGGQVDDPDLEVLHEEADIGSGVGSADADVVHAAAQAQGDVAGLADPVLADVVMSVGLSAVVQGGLGP